MTNRLDVAWTLDDLRAVRRLSSTCQVDAEQLAAGRGVRRRTHDRLARELAGDVRRRLGLELHLDDVYVVELTEGVDDDGRELVEFLAWWQPFTERAQLPTGELVEVRDVWRQLDAVTALELSRFEPGRELVPPAGHLDDTARLRIAGWLPDERAWILR